MSWENILKGYDGHVSQLSLDAYNLVVDFIKEIPNTPYGITAANGDLLFHGGWDSRGKPHPDNIPRNIKTMISLLEGKFGKKISEEHQERLQQLIEDLKELE
jgi:hypothetical protein